MNLISNAQAAADLEHQVDQTAVRMLEALVRGDRRGAVRALADSQACDLATTRLALALWVQQQLEVGPKGWVP